MKKANPVWQVILGLSRYGGLRTPSETLSLRWEDIDWELNRMSIPEPKVEHHEGRGIRSCPIFPELRLSSSQPKSDELVFIRISLNSVDRTNAAYHASWLRSKAE